MKNKKLFAILTLVCFMFTLMPVAVFAEEGEATDATPVAQVGTTNYATLQNAINAASSGDTVKLLANTELTNTVTIAGGQSITLDLNGTAITVATAGTFAFENYGTLTIIDSVGGGSITARIGVDNYGTLVLNGGTIVANEQGGAAIYNNAGSNANFTMNGGTLKATFVGSYADSTGGACIRNTGDSVTTITGGTLESRSARTYAIISNGTLNITPAAGSDVSMTAYRGIAVDAGTATINGGTFTVLDANAEEGTYVAYETYYALYVGGNDSVVTVNGGTFNAPDSAVWRPCWDDEGEPEPVDLVINGGTFNGSLIGNAGYYPSEHIVVYGGTFSENPNQFVATGYVATEAEGVWTVAKEEAKPAEVTPAAPTVNTTVTGVKEEVVDAVKDALTPTAESATPPSISADKMQSAADAVAEDNDVTISVATKALEDAEITVEENKTVSIVVQPYMDIQITGIETTTSDEVTAITELTLDITPKYQIVATTADVEGDEEIVTTGDNQNAVKINEGTLTIDKEVIVTVPLPASFVLTENVYVKHTKGNINYMYDGTVTNGILTFKNPHGFSEFTITAAVPEASIGSTSFATLQDAMNAANDNDVITINSVDTDEDVIVTVSDTKKVTLKNETGNDIVVTINDKPITIAAGKTATFSNKPSTTTSTGGGFSGTYNYPVSTTDVAGATVTFSDNNAVAGETVTITVTPDSGKQVDEVIVTDADGDVIPVTKVGDNQYTFIMPAGKVSVAVTTTDIDYDNKIVLQIGNKNVVVDGKPFANDVAPQLLGDRTLVPIRVIVEALGGDVHWNGDTRTVTINIDGKVLTLVIDEMIPGFGQGAIIMDSRTYVPIRYVAEYVGANVEWIAATQQIVVLK